MQTKLDEQFSNVEELISISVQKAIQSVEIKLNTKLELSQNDTNKKLQDLEKKNSTTYSQLNNSIGIMSMKFDKMLQKLFPGDEEESTATPMDTDDGGKS